MGGEERGERERERGAYNRIRIDRTSSELVMYSTAASNDVK